MHFFWILMVVFSLFSLPAHANLSVAPDGGSLGLRYRFQMDENGAEVKNQLRYRLLLGGRVDLAQPRLWLRLRGVTGSSFADRWENLGVGRHDAPFDFHFYLRWLELGFQPIERLDLTAGSLGFEFDTASQLTNLDADGYFWGVRAKGYYLGEYIALEGGAVGGRPSLFGRLARIGFDFWNYARARFVNSLGSKYKYSFAYTYLDVAHFVGIAAERRISKEFRILFEDTFQFAPRISNILLLGPKVEVRIGELRVRGLLHYGYKSLFFPFRTGDPLSNKFDQNFLYFKGLATLYQHEWFGVDGYLRYVQGLTFFDARRIELGLTARL